MDNKIKIIGLGDILLIGENPDPQKDYLVAITAGIKEIKKNVEDIDNPFYVYVMKYKTTEMVQSVGGRKLRVEHARTQSQKMRWAIEKVGEKRGIDKDEFYQSETNKIISNYLSELED